MAIWSTITTSQIEYSRFDADFYQPRYLTELELWRKLNDKVGVSKLKRLIAAPVRTGRTPRSRAIKDGEPVARFIKTDTVRQGFVNFDKSVFLPIRVLTNHDYIPDNGVVVTIIGATPEIVGRAAIVRKEDPLCVTNQNVAVISTNEKCDPFFLTAYLQTAIGRDQLWRHSRRTEQVNLNCREVERILIPAPSLELQRTIGQLVRQSFAATDQSSAFYKDAEALLESELGLNKLSFQRPKAFAALFSDLECSRRSDAQHYQPQFTALLKHLDDFPNAKLRAVKKLNCRGVQPIYVNEGPIPIVNSQHLGPRHVSYGTLQRTSTTLFNSAPDAHILPNDLLVYTTGAYIGRTNVYLSDEPALASNHVNILRLQPEIDGAYMSLVMQSIVGQFQTQKHARGSAQAELYPSDIDKFVVPLLPPEAQKAIGDLLRGSLSKELESKRLLGEAKARVEQLIEEAVKS